MVKTYILLLIAVVCQAMGNVLLSKGMKQVASALEKGNVLSCVVDALGSPMIWSGTALVFVFFIIFAAALSWADLSFVLPSLSVEVIVNVAFAQLFLDEAVSIVRWIGVLLVSCGVILVIKSERAKVEIQ